MKPKPTIRMRLRPTAETLIRGGHPWVYSDSVRDQNREGEAGELAVIYDRKDRFLAIGLYDPNSLMRVRVLHCGKPVTVDDAWWQARLAGTLERRASLHEDESTTGYRLINRESDGWPGLVLDRYGDVLVLKLYTAAWLIWLEKLKRWIPESVSCERIVLRLSRNIQERAKDLRRVDGDVILGEALAGPVQFLENGLWLEADVIKGQKTGFFLDQRDNRLRVRGLARGLRVLNAFSFSGGFSLNAALGGACSVTDLDISGHALESAQRNFALNASKGAVSGCEHELVKADAFEWLRRERPRFDMVILDPPSLARREMEREGALKAYGNLAREGARLLGGKGILVVASCSAHVSAEEFFGIVKSSVGGGGVELGRTEEALDHPVTFAEGRYLKCLFLRLGGAFSATSLSSNALEGQTQREP